MNKPKITVIGASNVDITGFTKSKLIYQDANIGTMETSAGGVGRNIAENLMRLGFDVNLISVFGDDALSSFIIDSCKKLNLNIEGSLLLNNTATPTFIAIMDEHNDLALGISAMTIFDSLSDDFILNQIEKIKKSDYVILETNMPEKILKAVVSKAPNQKYVLDTVSGKKGLRAKGILKYLYILKTNLLEANIVSGLNIENPDEYPKLIQYFLEKGVKNVFITLGEEGVVFGNANEIKTMPTIQAKIVNTIGAGDAFVSGIVYGDSLNLNSTEIAKIGMLAANLNVQCNTAVSPDMSVQKIRN